MRAKKVSVCERTGRVVVVVRMCSLAGRQSNPISCLLEVDAKPASKSFGFASAESRPETEPRRRLRYCDVYVVYFTF